MWTAKLVIGVIFVYVLIGALIVGILDSITNAKTKDALMSVILVLTWPELVFILIVVVLYDTVVKICDFILTRKEKKNRLYECKKDAVSHCDKPADLCCFECEDNNECKFWHCDEYDNHEYGEDCPHIKKVNEDEHS